MYDKQLRQDIKFIQSLGWSKHKCKSVVGAVKNMNASSRSEYINKIRKEVME